MPIDKGQQILAGCRQHVVHNPDWAGLSSSPPAQAEVPLAALVGETVITGRIGPIDRRTRTGAACNRFQDRTVGSGR